METWRLADLHAYVDDCLEPDERLAFENRMAQDPALARRATAWRTQNSAIRAALDGEGAKAFSISLVRHQNEVLNRGRRPAMVGGKPGDQPARSSLTAVADTTRSSAEAGKSSALRPSFLWRLALAALSLGLACIWAPAAVVVRAKELGAADVAAFRASPSRRCAGRIGHRRQDRSGSLADDAAHAPRHPARDPTRRQTDRRADRPLPRRACGVSALQVPR